MKLELLNQLQQHILKHFTNGKISADDNEAIKSLGRALEEMTSKDMNLLSLIELIKRIYHQNLINVDSDIIIPADDLLSLNNALFMTRSEAVRFIDDSLPNTQPPKNPIKIESVSTTLNFRALKPIIDILRLDEYNNAAKILNKLLNKDPNPIFSDIRMYYYFALGIKNVSHQDNSPISNSEILARISDDIVPHLKYQLTNFPINGRQCLLEIQKRDSESAIYFAKQILSPSEGIDLYDTPNYLVSILETAVDILKDQPENEYLLFSFLERSIIALNYHLSQLGDDDYTFEVDNFISFIQSLIEINKQINTEKLLDVILTIYINPANMKVRSYLIDAIKTLDKSSQKERLIQYCQSLKTQFDQTVDPNNAGVLDFHKSELAMFIPFLYDFDDHRILKLYRDLLWTLGKQDLASNLKDIKFVQAIKVLGMPTHLASFKEAAADLLCEFYDDPTIKLWAKAVYACDAFSIIQLYKTPEITFECFSPYMRCVADILNASIGQKFYPLKEHSKYLRYTEYEYYDKNITYDTLDSRWFVLAIYYFNIYKGSSALPEGLLPYHIEHIDFKIEMSYEEDPIIPLINNFPFDYPNYLQILTWFFDENRSHTLDLICWATDTDFYLRLLRSNSPIAHNEIMPLMIGYARKMLKVFEFLPRNDNNYYTLLRWWDLHISFLSTSIESQEFESFPVELYEIYLALEEKTKQFLPIIKLEFKKNRDLREDFQERTGYFLETLAERLPIEAVAKLVIMCDFWGKLFEI